jgi:hypothetical protein
MKTARPRLPARWGQRWPQACIAAALAGLAAITLFAGRHAQAQERRDEHLRLAMHERVPPHWVLDNRFHHDHYYPAPGSHVAVLPAGRIDVRFGPDRLFFQGGVWFRPVGREYVVVAPPFGVAVPVLPPAYATLWIGGSAYYYANGVYYANAVGAPGYVVVAPPPHADQATVQAAPVARAAPAGELIATPRNGQPQHQVFTDRAECARWATGQSGGYEPSQPRSGDAAGYRRAETACLEGRGYTVR